MPRTDDSTRAGDALRWCLPSIYGERYALAACGGGSVLLDLDSGAFYQLNPVAAAICAGLARDEPAADIARGLAAAYQIPPDRAAADVEAVLTQMGRAP